MADFWSFNRTFMELKYSMLEEEWTDSRFVLIVPLWNWNDIEPLE